MQETLDLDRFDWLLESLAGGNNRTVSGAEKVEWCRQEVEEVVLELTTAVRRTACTRPGWR